MSELDVVGDIRALFRSIEIVPVSQNRPHNQKEFEQLGNYWPIIYRPTDVSIERDRGLSISEISCMSSHLQFVKDSSQGNDFGCLVHPMTNEVFFLR
jgi:hypothetical protein